MDTVTLLLTGDVMTGRGIDQLLPHPGSPTLFESCMHDARGYVHLVERASGPVERAVPPDHLWGDAHIDAVVVTDSVPAFRLPAGGTVSKKLRVVSAVPLFAQAVRDSHTAWLH